MCADLWGANTAGNAPIVLRECDGQPAQQFTLSDDGSVRVLGKCVETPWGVTANGTEVHINPCNGMSQQMWTRQAGGQLQNGSSGRCLTIAGGVLTGPPQLVVADCDSANAFQQWAAATRAGTSNSGPVRNGGAPALCAELKWWNTTPGTPLVGNACGGFPVQTFTAGDDATLRVAGLCAEVPAALTAAGSPVRVNTCTGAANQRWTRSAGGGWLNEASGRCLTIPGAATTGMPELVVADCAPADAFQQWQSPAAAKAVSTSYVVNNADQLTSTTSGTTTTSFGYDQNGNQSSAGAVTSTFDLANRTASVTSVGAATTYSYDGLGKRLTSATNGSVDTRYSWDANNALPQLAAETDAAGALTRRYVNGIDGPVSMTSASGTSYYHRDGYGSVSDVTSATGAAQWAYAYEPFGAARSTSKVDPAAPANPMQYTGQYLDGATGTYHLRARQYDPNLGRFSATDPLAPPITDPYVSAYAYAGDAPTMFTDPSGMVSVGDVGRFVFGNVAGLNRNANSVLKIVNNPIGFAQDLGESAGQDYYGEDGTQHNWRRALYNVAVPWAGIENDINRAQSFWSQGCYWESGDAAADVEVKTAATALTAASVFAGGRALLGKVKNVVGSAGQAGESAAARLRVAMADDTGAIGPGVGDLKFARKVGLDVNNPAVANRGMTVQQFISKYWQAGVARQFPGEYLNQTVEQALRSGDSTVRKLLTDGRWAR